MTPVRSALTLVLVSAGLSGCGYFFGDEGYFRDRGADYQLAQVEPRMTVPAELNSKPIGDLLPVPGEIRHGSAESFTLPRPQGLRVGAEYSEFSLQQNGGDRWLLAQHPANSIWPRVRRFLTEYQVPVERESASTGEIETGWLAFEQDAGNPLVRRLLPAADPNRRIDGQESRFRLRVEPGVQAGSSEVKVLHMQRSQGSERNNWPGRSDSANLERVVLAELETFLNQSSGVDSVALSAAAVAETAAERRSTLGQDATGNPVLNINADFNRAWAAVGQALSAADIRVDDLNRSSGIYYVSPQQSASQKRPGFFARLFGRGGEGDERQGAEVQLTPVGQRVQVTVEHSSNAGEARALLERIHQNLN